MITLWSGQGLKALVGCGATPRIQQNALQGVNSKTVRWTVFEEGTLCTRERPLLRPANKTTLRNYSARRGYHPLHPSSAAACAICLKSFQHLPTSYMLNILKDIHCYIGFTASKCVRSVKFSTFLTSNVENFVEKPHLSPRI